MIQVDIRRLLPTFLLQDKNGYAMAKALEAGMQKYCEITSVGIDTVLDVDKMPEWRLDEMAWETSCLYDYAAGIEEKRAWIRNAARNYSQYGTKAAIVNYLSGLFEYVTVEENWEYGGSPFHFRVNVNVPPTEETERWAQSAIERVKNVRSVLDDIQLHVSATLEITPETENGSFYYPFPGDEQYCGMIYDDTDPF